MLRVALTGGFGSGKSVVGQIFQNLGAVVVDSDQLAREVIERGTPGFDQVINSFGDEVLKDGNIDRGKLGKLVFSDPEKRLILEGIIHPRVRARFEEILKSAKSGDIVINQIPLLVETNGAKNFDFVITVSAPLEQRRTRLEKRGFSFKDIEARFAAQVSDKEREAISNFVIENDSDLYSLESQAELIYEKLKEYASRN